MQGVVLTLSGKHGGVCLAIYSQNDNRMYRLVGDKNSGALPICLRNELDLLDVIDYTPVDHIKNGPQVENIQVDVDAGIKRIGKYNGDIASIHNSMHYDRFQKGRIFGSTFPALKKTDLLRHSLELIKVSDLKITKENIGNRITGKASFIYEDQQHKSYSVTDFEHDIRDKSVDCWYIGDAYLVISLPSDSYVDSRGIDQGYYKFISAIYEI